MRSSLTLLWVLAQVILTAQPEFTLKSGEQLSQRNRFGQSTEQLEAFIAANPTRLYDQSQALLLISYNHMQLGDYANALAVNEASLNIKAELHADDLVYNYVRFGAIHLLRGNYHTALSYLRRAKNFPIEEVPLFAVIDGYLAAAYRGLGLFEEAETYYRQSIETLLIEFPGDHPDVITSYYNLGELYLEWGRPEDALRYFRQGLERIDPASDQSFLQALLYNGLGRSYPDNPTLAESHFRKALEVAERHFGPYHRETAQAGIMLARVLYRQGRRDEAKAAIQGAIQSLTPEQPGLQWEQLPDTANLVIDRPLLAEALGLKAAWLMDAALPDEQKLLPALACSELAGELLEASLDVRIDQADRLELLQVARKSLEPGIAAAFQLWTDKQDASAWQRAFQLVELVKMMQFRIYTGHALQLSGAHAEAEREKLRALQLAEMSFRIQPRDLSMRREVLLREAAYRKAVADWRQADPVGYLQRFGWPILPATAVQNEVPEGMSVLSYFTGEQGLYLFAFDKQERYLGRLDAATGETTAAAADADLASHIQLLRQGIDSSDAAAFAASAHALYNQLIAPAASRLKSADELLILPDGPLWEVPFEALLPKVRKRLDKAGFHKLTYLLEDHAVRYQYSASIWAGSKLDDFGQPAYDLLFLSPVFDQEKAARIAPAQQLLFDPLIHPASVVSDGRRFNLLSHVESDARELKDIFGVAERESLLQLRERATESLLKQELGRAHYIHLATYGFVSGPSPEEAGLILATPQATDESPDDGLLLASELLHVPHASPLELISVDFMATGNDHAAHSAGLIPLNGSLLLAGVPNVLYANRPDGSSLLFTYFYEHLLAGRPMGKALQLAKLSLVGKKETASPKFWSGYRLVGE